MDDTQVLLLKQKEIAEMKAAHPELEKQIDFYEAWITEQLKRAALVQKMFSSYRTYFEQTLSTPTAPLENI